MQLNIQNIRLMTLALILVTLGGCGGGGGATGTAPIYSGIDTIDTAIDWFFGTDSTATDTPSLPATPVPDATSVAPADAESALDLAALEAVFAMVDDLPDESIALAQSRFPPKPPGVFRAAILLPLSGQFEALGQELRQAVDLAVLSLQQPRFEVIFIDSQPRADDAVREAIAANTDMIIGPVFASATRAAVPVAADYGVPVLSFSNTAGVSASGAWILGQRPEQEIDAVMRYALYELRRDKGVALPDARVAVIRDANNYGRKLSAYAVDWLRNIGVRNNNISPLVLTGDDLANEASVRQVVQDFIGWVDGEAVISNETLAILAADPPLLAAAEVAFEEEGLPAPFDIILFCGSTDFTLRVAPVLAWHDLDATANVRFVGTSQWNRPEAIGEPSLQGGVFASPPQESRARFDATWQRYYQTSASPLAPLGYDAVAIASAVANDRRRVGLLEQGIDFVGFSGAFRLMPDGSNDRHVELRRIRRGTSSAIFIPQVVEDAIAAALRPERGSRGRGRLFF